MRALLLLLLSAMPASAVPLPLVCEVTSEEVPTISIRLEERTPTALRGVLIQDDKRLGIFMSSKPKQYRQTTWSFFTQDAANSGTALLFENDLVWNPHKRVPKPQDVNRVIFVGLENALLFWRLTRFFTKKAFFLGSDGKSATGTPPVPLMIPRTLFDCLSLHQRFNDWQISRKVH